MPVVIINGVAHGIVVERFLGGMSVVIGRVDDGSDSGKWSTREFNLEIEYTNNRSCARVSLGSEPDRLL